MAKRLVVADASPLIGLAAANAFDLLRRLFDVVTVTTAVRDEVLAGGDRPGARDLAAAIETGWIVVVRSPRGASAFAELGAGEASTLALALQRNRSCLVLMDETMGRARARAEGISCTGLAGVLLAAKRARLIRRVAPLLASLEESGFRISGEVVAVVLEEAGES